MKDHRETIEALGQLTANNDKGDKVIISTLWQKQKAVLVFIRHFG